MGCWCIVVVRWTGQLPRGFPFAIIVSNTKSKPLITTVSPVCLQSGYHSFTVAAQNIAKLHCRKSMCWPKKFTLAHQTFSLWESVGSGDKTTKYLYKATPLVSVQWLLEQQCERAGYYYNTWSALLKYSKCILKCFNIPTAPLPDKAVRASLAVRDNVGVPIAFYN